MLEKYYVVLLVILSPLMAIAGRYAVIAFRRRILDRVAAKRERVAPMQRA